MGECVSFVDGHFLSVELKDNFTLPYDGWHYFESIELAKEFFGIVDIEQ